LRSETTLVRVSINDELELFIDKKVIFAAGRLSANFLIRITFFPFNLDTSLFQVEVL
jgi:hypothetical protein